MRCCLTLLLLSSSAAMGAEPKVRKDVPCADAKDERRTLDVYGPQEGTGRPIAFWIHGGGWQGGDKTQVKTKPQAFVERGFVFASTNYRFVPKVPMRELVGDVAKALRWVHDHAGEFGGDPDRIFIMGHSAGAQLAALLCTDERYLKAEGLSFAMLKGCVPVDGDTYDLPMQIATVEQRRKDAFRMKFGDEAHQKDFSAVTHVARDKGIPPFLLLHVAGHPETTAQAQRLAKAPQGAGVPARAYAGQGKDHHTLCDDLGTPGDEPSKELFAFVLEAVR